MVAMHLEDATGKVPRFCQGLHVAASEVTQQQRLIQPEGSCSSDEQEACSRVTCQTTYRNCSESVQTSRKNRILISVMFILCVMGLETLLDVKLLSKKPTLLPFGRAGPGRRLLGYGSDDH